MTKVRFSIRSAANSATVRRRGFVVVALVAMSGCVLWAVTSGAQQNDSGWVVATPSPLGSGGAADPHQQMLLQNLLEQTEQPLLQKPASTVAVKSAKENKTETRVAVRPEGSFIWRPAALASSPVSGEAASHAAADAAVPLLNAPAANGPPAKAQETQAQAQTAEELDCDCSGQPSRAKKSMKGHALSSTPALADAYGNLPGVQSSQEAEDSGQSQPSAKETGHEPEDGVVNETDESTLEAGVEKAFGSGDAVKVAPAPGKHAPAPAVEKHQAEITAKPATPQVETPPPPLTKQLLALRTRVRSVLSGYYRKPLASYDNDPWEAMHGMLAYGINSRIHQGSQRGELITSVGWLCYNKPCKGQTLLYVNPQGEVRAKYGVGLQGHLGQLLAMLAQCHVSADYPIHVGTKEFTIHDLIESEKKTCYPKSELTFKLIALQHYIDLDEKWVNDQGVDWDIPRLMREEMAQPIRGAACGGTHRLSGLSLTVKQRLRRGEPLDGEYAKANEFVKKYQQYAFRLQNRDGSLSTSWFRGAGDEDDLDRRIKTTGHILEWLCYSLTDEELRDPRTIRAVTYLSNIMYSNYDHEWEIGPRSHATHALLLYDERVFRPFDKEGTVASYRPTPQVANSNQQGTTKR